jgi:hypothetical protein
VGTVESAPGGNLLRDSTCGWVVMQVDEFGVKVFDNLSEENYFKVMVPASEKSLGMFFFARVNGISSTQLYISSNCSYVSSSSISFCYVSDDFLYN